MRRKPNSMLLYWVEKLILFIFFFFLFFLLGLPIIFQQLCVLFLLITAFNHLTKSDLPGAGSVFNKKKTTTF